MPELKSTRENCPRCGTVYSTESAGALCPRCIGAFEYRIVRPNGEMETVLKVPNYDFNWQITYFPAKPIHLEKGSKIEVIAEFDNSANNKFNPDPTQEVHWGEQTFEEMMMGYFSVVVDSVQSTDPVQQ